MNKLTHNLMLLQVSILMPKECVISFRWPINATPAADPIDSMLPPTPAVKVAKSHCPVSISGNIVSTAYITGMLSTIADKIPLTR